MPHRSELNPFPLTLAMPVLLIWVTPCTSYHFTTRRMHEQGVNKEATKHVWKAAPYGLIRGSCTTYRGMVERSRQPSAGALTPLVVLQSPSHSSPISLCSSFLLLRNSSLRKRELTW